MANSSLKKFNQLSQGVKDGLSSVDFFGVVESLEQEYSAKLFSVFVQLVVKDITIGDLENYLSSNTQLDDDQIGHIKIKFSQLLNKLNDKFPGYDAVLSQGVVTTEQATGDGIKSNFNFFAEDEKEVENLKADLPASGHHNYDSLATDIINRFGFDAQDQVFYKRLLNIVMARLKDVRDDFETKEVLQKNRKIGGLEFSTSDVSRLLSLIKRANLSGTSGSSRLSDASRNEASINFPIKKPFRYQKTTISDKKQNQPDDAPAPFAPVASSQIEKVENIKKDDSITLIKNDNIQTPVKPAVKPEPSPVKQSLIKIEDEDGLPVIKFPDDDLMIKPKMVDVGQKSSGSKPEFKPQPSSNVGAHIDSQAPQVSAQKPSSIKPPSPRPAPAQSAGGAGLKMYGDNSSRKPKLDDIKISRVLMGPVEELSHMTLIDFRRLSADPLEAIKKVEAKINLLEQDSYAKRIEGIDGWNRNEINKFYRLLGQKSMNEGKSIEQIINERLEADKPTLSVAEFEAIMDLNRRVRY